MKAGLIDVAWWWGLGQYDRVYMSKAFDCTYTPDMALPLNVKKIVQGGTGYFRGADALYHQ